MIPRLHIVTDDEILARESFIAQARAVLGAGGPAVALHLRGPGWEGGGLFRLARDLRSPAEDSGALLLVNDRVDVALALDLSGVHLGQRSLPSHVTRGLLGSDRLLGVSVHREREAEEAGGSPDYLVAGTLFATASHPGGVPGGVGRIREIRGVTRLPLVGIGGISPARVFQVLAAGAHGVAVRGGIWNSPDPATAVGVFLERIEDWRNFAGAPLEPDGRAG